MFGHISLYGESWAGTQLGKVWGGGIFPNIGLSAAGDGVVKRAEGEKFSRS